MVKWWVESVITGKGCHFLVGYNRVWWYQGVISVLGVGSDCVLRCVECAAAVCPCSRTQEINEQLDESDSGVVIFRLRCN